MCDQLRIIVIGSCHQSIVSSLMSRVVLEHPLVVRYDPRLICVEDPIDWLDIAIQLDNLISVALHQARFTSRVERIRRYQRRHPQMPRTTLARIRKRNWLPPSSSAPSRS